METIKIITYRQSERRRLRRLASIVCPNITWKVACVIVALFLLASTLFIGVACAENAMYVFCEPSSEVNIRNDSSSKGDIEGYLRLGDKVVVDDISSDRQWYHCVGLGIESGGGWVSECYLSKDRVVAINQKGSIDSDGRVAARKSPGGKRKMWLSNGDSLTIYAISDEWAVTDKGYIMLKYISY